MRDFDDFLGMCACFGGVTDNEKLSTFILY
jgi:hypothetical protein